MLNETFPEQFIEGINESEDLTDGNLPTFGGYGIAIPYTPCISYVLAGIEVFISPSDEPKEYVVKLCTDYHDNPSVICLVDGKMVIPIKIISQWLKIELKQSVAIFSRRKYWLCFPEHPLRFCFGVAKSGEELSIRANPSEQWVSSASDKKYRFMFRFYGRVIPVVA